MTQPKFSFEKIALGYGDNADFDIRISIVTDQGNTVHRTLSREEVVDFVIDLITNADAKEALLHQLDIISRMSASIPNKNR